MNLIIIIIVSTLRLKILQKEKNVKNNKMK